MPPNRLRDQLDPYWGPIDRLITQDLSPAVSGKSRRYFEACRLKLKAIWYLKNTVEDLDRKYGRHVDAMLGTSETDTLPLNHDGSRSYCPFFEMVEFENLLIQAKSCLDCFARAIGAQFNENPRNLQSLEKILKQAERSSDRTIRDAASGILQIIDAHKPQLIGVILDPGPPPHRRPGTPDRKSIRDLISHYESAPVHFRITSGRRSKTAEVRRDHPQLVHLINYGVPYWSRWVWYRTRNLIEGSLTHSRALSGS